MSNSNHSLNNALASPGVSDHQRRLYIRDDRSNRNSRSEGKNKERWQVHRMTEDYVNVVGDLMYPKKTYDQFGYMPAAATVLGVVASTSSSGKATATSATAAASATAGSVPNSSGGLPMLSRINTLGYLTNPLRRKNAVEMWSPYEVAVFEACMTLYGKNFHKIQKQIDSKSTKEIIAFYYFWKKTSHYKQWKKAYVPDARDTPVLLSDDANSSTPAPNSTE